jgi:CBS domain-containing protein
MENQPRDESRSATVREGGPESWTEAGEFIDEPSHTPTATGSRTPTDLPSRDAPTSGTGSGRTDTGAASRGSNAGDAFRATGSRLETDSPGGSDFSSSADPIGRGSNTPVGDEPETFQAWDENQPEPGMDGSGRSMKEMLSASGGVLTAVAAGGLAYAMWRRRQNRNTRTERFKKALLAAGMAAGAEMPRMIGKAAAQSRSPWLPFVLLPVGLWLRERGKAGERASDQMLEPLDLESRGRKLARQGADMFEDYSRRWIHDIDPTADRGVWGWTPWILTGVTAGGAYYAYRQGWISMPSNVPSMPSMSDMSSMTGMSSGDSSKMVRDLMTRAVETVKPEATVADVARKMRDLDVGSLPVCDGQRLVGMVTDRDLSVRAAAEGKDPTSTAVRDVMSPEVTWVFEDEPAEMASSVMRRRQIRRLPVLDRNDKLVGVVSLGDLATDLGNDRLKGQTLEDISEPSKGSRRE